MPPISRPFSAKREQAGADVVRQLRLLQDDLDMLVAGLGVGIGSNTTFDEYEHRAHRIANGIRAAFRERKLR